MTTTTPAVGSFSDVPLHSDRSVAPSTEDAVREHVEAAAAAHWYTPDQLVWHTPEDIDVKPVYIAADRAGIESDGYPLNSFPGEPPFRPRPLPDDVCQPALDDPSVRRILHGGRVECVLPAQPGRRTKGSVSGVRPRHPPRLRLGPPPRCR